MLWRTCVVQTKTGSIYHSDRPALTGHHELDHAGHTQTRDLSAVKDTDRDRSSDLPPVCTCRKEAGPLKAAVWCGEATRCIYTYGI